MDVNLRQIYGPWDDGWVLDKHSKSSQYAGENEYGYPTYNTVRTEAGEATFQLKYRCDWSQIEPLAQAIADKIYPKLGRIGFIVPMPATNHRARQPVSEVADRLGELLDKPVFRNILLKAPNGASLKNMNTKEEKVAALTGSFSVHDAIKNEGRWNVLVIDDLFHTGASMEMACNGLRTYKKVERIYVAALTWR